MKTETIEYFYRGQIECGNGKGSYVWRDGYSANSKEGRVLYPWMSFRECQRDAAAQGKKAKIIRR